MAATAETIHGELRDSVAASYACCGAVNSDCCDVSAPSGAVFGCAAAVAKTGHRLYELGGLTRVAHGCA